MATITIDLNNETGDESVTLIHNRNGELIQQSVIDVENISGVNLTDIQPGDTITIA